MFSLFLSLSPTCSYQIFDLYWFYIYIDAYKYTYIQIINIEVLPASGIITTPFCESPRNQSVKWDDLYMHNFPTWKLLERLEKIPYCWFGPNPPTKRGWLDNVAQRNMGETTTLQFVILWWTNKTPENLAQIALPKGNGKTSPNYWFAGDEEGNEAILKYNFILADVNTRIVSLGRLCQFQAVVCRISETPPHLFSWKCRWSDEVSSMEMMPRCEEWRWS